MHYKTIEQEKDKEIVALKIKDDLEQSEIKDLHNNVE